MPDPFGGSELLHCQVADLLDALLDPIAAAVDKWISPHRLAVGSAG